MLIAALIVGYLVGGICVGIAGSILRFPLLLTAICGAAFGWFYAQWAFGLIGA